MGHCNLKAFSERKDKGKVFPLQAWAGPWGPGTLRLLDFLDFRHYEGGKLVTLTHRPSLPPGVFLVLILEAESTPGHMVTSVATEKIPSDTTGDRSRDPPTSSVVHWPLRYPPFSGRIPHIIYRNLSRVFTDWLTVVFTILMRWPDESDT
jgi:hypothetical protein